MTRSAAAAALSLASLSPAGAMETDGTIPAGTHVFFHVGTTLSSNDSATGQAFAFTLAKPIDAPGIAIPVEGTTGIGTVYLAGRAGTSGHEGDLTLRLDSLRTADGRTVTFDDERLQINGRNRKVASGVLGLLPYVGAASIFIRGSEIRLDPSVSTENILDHAARVAPPVSVAACEPRGTCDARGFTVSVATAGADDHGPLLRFTLTNDTDAPIELAATPAIATVRDETLYDVAAAAPPRRIANHCPAAPEPATLATPPPSAPETAAAAASPPAASPAAATYAIPAHGSLSVVKTALLCEFDMKTGRKVKGAATMGGPVTSGGRDAGYAMTISNQFEITP